MNKSKLAIIGAGELGLQILDLLNYSSEKFIAVGFFDDTMEVGSKIAGIEVLGGLNDIEIIYRAGIFDKLIIAIGYKHMAVRENLFLKYDKQIPFAKIIHNSCIMNNKSKIGDGSVLYPGCIIDKNVSIGNNVLLNLGVTIAHDCLVGNNSFFVFLVVVSGFVHIGKNCFVGTNATIIDNITIGENTIVGAGSVVIKDVNDNTKIVGNPAK